MSVKFYHNGEWLPLAGQKVYDGSQWRQLNGSNLIYLQDSWCYLEDGYELYSSIQGYEQIQLLSDAANWVDVYACNLGCVALNAAGEVWAFEPVTGSKRKLADGIVQITNNSLVRADGTIYSYDVYFSWNAAEKIQATVLPRIQKNTVVSGRLALSASGEIFKQPKNSFGMWTKKIGDKSDWVQLQAGSSLLALALDRNGNLAALDSSANLPQNTFSHIGKVLSSGTVTQNAVIDDTGKLYVADAYGRWGSYLPMCVFAGACASWGNVYAFTTTGELYALYFNNEQNTYRIYKRENGLSIVNVSEVEGRLFFIARKAKR